MRFCKQLIGTNLLKITQYFVGERVFLVLFRPAPLIHLNIIYNLIITFISALCQPLNPPSNGAVTWDGLTKGSTANYTCDSGYYVTGDNTRTCQNGRWTGQPPVCTGMIFVNNIVCMHVNADYYCYIILSEDTFSVFLSKLNCGKWIGSCIY